MQAKDTVKPTPDHSESVWCPHCGEEFGEESLVEATREEQAEITFPLGKQEGIEEVVEWFNEQTDFADDEPCPYYVMNKKVWQAKLKEWKYKVKEGNSGSKRYSNEE